MSANEAKRITKEFTPEELDRQRRQRQLIADELPQLVHRDQMRKEAQDEPTLSGEFRRAIHSSQLSLAAIASKAGVTTVALDEFLTGERTLRSDVLDRLATVLGLRIQATT
jgi:hypothetical protein